MRFVIIAARRTGSSHLVNVLSGHPEIFCHGNVFDERMMAIFWPKGEHPKPKLAKELKENLRKLRESDQDAYLEKVFSTSYGRPNVGFKIFQGENNSIWERILADRTIRKIILFRRNILAIYSSALAAQETGKWGVEKGDELPEAPPVKFAEAEFVKFYQRHIRFYTSSIEKLNSSQELFHLVNYEEINDPLLLGGTITFIGADATKAISEERQRKQQVKLNPSNIMTRFSNVEDVEAFTRKHNLLHWQQEGETSLSQF